MLGNTGATLEDLGRNSGEFWGNLVMGGCKQHLGTILGIMMEMIMGS